MEQVSMRVSKVVQNPDNCRTHSKRQIAQLKRSISVYSFYNPNIVDEHHVLIAGHGRLAAAEQLGLQEVPAIILSGLSDVAKRALALLDNKVRADLRVDEVPRIWLSDHEPMDPP